MALTLNPINQNMESEHGIHDICVYSAAARIENETSLQYLSVPYVLSRHGAAKVRGLVKTFSHHTRWTSITRCAWQAFTLHVTDLTPILCSDIHAVTHAHWPEIVMTAFQVKNKSVFEE